MAPSTPRPSVLLPFALLAACLALTAGQAWSPLNDLFRKEHVDFPKTPSTNNNAYCNRMMWARLMYWRYSNTFIHAPNENVTEVCKTAGVADGPFRYLSNEPFSITLCTFNPWSISYTGLSATQRIVISCWNDLPVYYVKGVQP